VRGWRSGQRRAKRPTAVLVRELEARGPVDASGCAPCQHARIRAASRGAPRDAAAVVSTTRYPVANSVMRQPCIQAGIHKGGLSLTYHETPRTLPAKVATTR